MYLERHRAVQTTQSRTKRNFRMSEHLIREAEYVSTLASIQTDYGYPKKVSGCCSLVVHDEWKLTRHSDLTSCGKDYVSACSTTPFLEVLSTWQSRIMTANSPKSIRLPRTSSTRPSRRSSGQWNYLRRSLTSIHCPHWPGERSSEMPPTTGPWSQSTLNPYAVLWRTCSPPRGSPVSRLAMDTKKAYDVCSL